jgi:hypothetical protein
LPGWRVHKIDVLRKRPITIAGTKHVLVQHIGVTHHFSRRPKLYLDFRLDDARPEGTATKNFLRSVNSLLPRATASLGSQGFERGKVYANSFLRAISQVDSMWEALLESVSSTASNRAQRLEPRVRWSQGEIENLVRFLIQAGPLSWLPGYVCFRRRRFFAFGGYRWVVQYEGLWNEYGDDPLSVDIWSSDEMTQRDWKMVKRSGFVEQLAEDLGVLGLSMSLRARRQGKHAWMHFSKRVKPRQFETAARKLLSWRIPRKIGGPARTPRPELFAKD